jgi:hypothetical protein
MIDVLLEFSFGFSNVFLNFAFNFLCFAFNYLTSVASNFASAYPNFPFFLFEFAFNFISTHKILPQTGVSALVLSICDC